MIAKNEKMTSKISCTFIHFSEINLPCDGTKGDGMGRNYENTLEII